LSALGGVLIFSGLLLACMAPIAAVRARRAKAWSAAVAGLEIAPIAELPRDGSLCAVRGKVESDEPVEDPVTGDDVVWCEVETRVGESTSSIVHDGGPFLVRDESGAAWVDPAGAREIAVRIDEFEPDHDRKSVASFLKKRGLANRADVSIVHRAIPVGVDLVVVGRGREDERAPHAEDEAGYREGRERLTALTASNDAELVLTTHSLDAFRERELASVKSGTAGVVILAALGLGCAAVGAAVLLSLLG
jgi:hypothetical protein